MSPYKTMSAAGIVTPDSGIYFPWRRLSVSSWQILWLLTVSQQLSREPETGKYKQFDMFVFVIKAWGSSVYGRSVFLTHTTCFL